MAHMSIPSQRITVGEWQQGGGACACHTVTGSEAGLTGDCPPSLQGTAGHQPDATVGWCHQLADMARLRCVERRFEACGNATGPKDIFGSSAVPRFIIPPARLQRAHTHSVWVSFDQGSHGHRPVTRHSAGMHTGASMLQCACMPTRIRCSRPLSSALPRALDHRKSSGLPSVGVPGTGKMCPQSAGEVARGSGFCFFTVCTACMHFWRRQRKRPWAATGAVRRKVIFKSSSATEQWGLGVGLGRVQFEGRCARTSGPLTPSCLMHA